MELKPIEVDVLELLEAIGSALTSGAIQSHLPHHEHKQIRHVGNDLFQKGLVRRVKVQGAHDNEFFAYFHPEARTEFLPQAIANSPLDPELAQRLIQRLEADLEQVEEPPAPAPVVERRLVFSESWTALDVIDRWKLSYRLSRIIDIIWSSRRKGLTQEDAAQIGLLARQHAATPNGKGN